MNHKHIFLLLALAIISEATAKMGCMDNSKHGDTSNGYDYKNYHYVYCTCPCERYKQSFNRGRCEQCWHFHDVGESFHASEQFI